MSTTRHGELMERLHAFYPVDVKGKVQHAIKASAQVVIEDANSSGPELIELIHARMKRFNPERNAWTDKAIHAYAQYFYEVIFVEMHQGDRALLQSHIDAFSGGCYEAMYGAKSVGRPAKRKGRYVPVTLEIRDDLLKQIDAMPQSRREIIEKLFLDKWPQGQDSL